MSEQDTELAEPQNGASSTIGDSIEYVLQLGHYTGARRGGRQGGPGDNPYYRKNKHWMPGWKNTFGIDLDPHGAPSAATAQDRATNYVGHHDPDGIWTGVRNRLMHHESNAHAAAIAENGPDAHMSFTQLYRAHVAAYGEAQEMGNPSRVAHGERPAGNTFIDPISFAMAAYGAPLLEHAGINTGPITGASIDLFNDPTDTVGDGWAKRMGLSATEIGAGLGGMALSSWLLAHGKPQLALASLLGGAGMIGAGAASGVWNTATAIGNGMGLGDAVSGIGHVGSSLVHAGGQMASDGWHKLTSLF